MGKSSHLNNLNNCITKSRTSILVIWCSVSPVTRESDSLPELRSPVRTHLFSLNHCIWYSSAAATHSDFYSLQSSALPPHNSALCLGIVVHVFLWLWFKWGWFAPWEAMLVSTEAGEGGKCSNREQRKGTVVPKPQALQWETQAWLITAQFLLLCHLGDVVFTAVSLWAGRKVKGLCCKEHHVGWRKGTPC